jgi:hypothetical protein
MAHAMYGAESGAAVGPGDVPSNRYLEIRAATMRRANVSVALLGRLHRVWRQSEGAGVVVPEKTLA